MRITIALSSISSKIFEHVILFRHEDCTSIWTYASQFGFKPSHSTDLCVFLFISKVDPLRNLRGIP